MKQLFNLLGFTLILACLAFSGDSPTLVYGKSIQAILAKDGKAHTEQFIDAVTVNIRKDLRKDLAPIVAAIRYSENGRKGLEYGIIHKRVLPTYRSQAGWCAATVQKDWDRYCAALGVIGTEPNKIDFIDHLARRYCPVGADNDPNGLNVNWPKNVKSFYAKFKPCL